MGPLVVWDPEINTTVSPTDCVASAEDLLNGVEIECSGGEPFFGDDGAINPVAHVAKAMGISRQCAHRWLARWDAEGEADRKSVVRERV